MVSCQLCQSIGERPFKRWQREHGLQICKKNDIVMTRDLKIPKISSIGQSSPVPPREAAGTRNGVNLMKELYLQKVTSQDMVNKIRGMRSEEINTYLTELVRLPVRIFGGVWKPPTTILQSRMLSLKHRRLTIPMQRSPKPSSMKRCWRLQEERTSALPITVLYPMRFWI